jgi:hypothetical protein
MNRVVIVVPCFDEADRLDGAAFADFARNHPDVGFLFVNDGSATQRDRSWTASGRAIPIGWEYSISRGTSARRRRCGLGFSRRLEPAATK